MKENLAALMTSKTGEHHTPPDLFRRLELEFGRFDVDAAATDENHLAPAWYTSSNSGLTNPWRVHGSPWITRVFVNPPYGRDVGAWLEKAARECDVGCLVVLLLPARTDTRWFHDVVVAGRHEVRLIRGRLRFGDAVASAPFPSMVVVMRPPSFVGFEEAA